MRIAFVYDALYPETKGGVERRVWELARLLVRDGFSVEILSPHLWDGPRVLEREGVILRAVSKGGSLYRRSGRRAVFPSLRHAFGVLSCLRRETYDVIDCQIPAHPAALAAWLGTRKRPRTHLVITWHEAWGNHWFEEFGWLGYGGRALEKFVAHIPATHLAVSASVESSLVEVGGLPAAVIEAGVDLKAIDTVEPGASGDVVFVGRLVPTKNIELLLRSISTLEGQGRTVTCTIIGDGPMRSDLQRATNDLGLAEQVTFLGALEHWEEVIAAMKGSKVLASPSLREGFGLVAIEAAACGLPVVTVDHPRNAARRLVADGKTGLVTDTTTMAFAAGIARILEDQPLRQAMAAESRTRVEGAGWDRTVDQTLAWYRRVAA